MDSMPGHAGHNMAGMSNISLTTTMVMIVANMSMGPDMHHHNGSVDHPTHSMPNVTAGHDNSHHHTSDNKTTIGDGNSNHMHHNGSMNSGNHTGHSHETNGMHGTGDHNHHENGDAGDGNTHNHGSNGSEGSHSGHGAGHNMVFNFNMPLFVLFVGWEVTNGGQLAGACIAWFLLAIVHEGLKNLRDCILTRSLSVKPRRIVMGYRNYGTEHECGYHLLPKNRKTKYKPKADSNGSDGDVHVRTPEKSNVQKMFDGWHIFLSFLQIIQTTLGMFLMLVYMTFNVYLAISVSIGSGVGYWLFAWNRRQSNRQFDDDHCV